MSGIIGSLRGVVLERSVTNGALVEVGGVGYRVQTTPHTLGALREGTEVFLHVHHVVREDAQALYGFLDRDERGAFEALLGAHGVGPALALAILGTHRPLELRRAIAEADLAALCLVPGVGKKTAERLLVELKRRLDVPEADVVGAITGTDRAAPSTVGSVRDALAGLGYDADEIRDALRDLPPETDAAVLLRKALAVLGRTVRDELLQPDPGPDDVVDEVTLRPKSLADFVGQAELKEHLAIVLEAARRRGQAADHLLFAGPPGLGKTTLAAIVAAEMGVHLHVTSGPALERPGDMAAILTKLDDGDVLFIDEIHRLSRSIEEILYPAMEDFVIDIVVGKGPAASSIRLTVPQFTLVGATTRTGLITGPLRDRFGLVARLDYYEVPDLESIVRRAAGILGIPVDVEGAHEIARRARGTPRLANRLLRRVRDFAEVRGNGIIDHAAAKEGLAVFGVDDLGLDKVDRALLGALCRQFGGGPVGLSTLAIAVGEQPETVEDVYEPFLIQQGLLMRTPRGRVTTPAAYHHLGLLPPARPDAASLFD